MFFEIVAGEIGVAFHYVDDYGAPSVDVTRLGFVEDDVAADYVCAKTGKVLTSAWGQSVDGLTGSTQLLSRLDSIAFRRHRQDTSAREY